MLQLLLSLAMAWSIFAGQEFPLNPDPQLTPGSLCDQPNSRRYPERIPYCERHVSKSTKWQVIETYNRELRFQIERRDRQQFKIDHRIPLCAGGSNRPDNLWPQHESVYRITDPLEGLACEKMARGRLTQAYAVELLGMAKMNLQAAPRVQEILESL